MTVRQIQGILSAMGDMYSPPNDKPLMRVLSYSGGRQSHAIARMCLRGELPMPDMVVAADPGNEHVDTYRFRDRTLAEFRAVGVGAVVAPGPQMLYDLTLRLNSEAQRIDNAAYWTENGGQLSQGCTRHYKIRPMRRAILRVAYERFGRRLAPNSIESWIGFAWDERHRVKPTDDVRFQYNFPLFWNQMTRKSVDEWYAQTGELVPPPSVCNHCWANGIETFKRIAETDPEGWEKAKEFDRLSRDMRKFGVNEQCYCSSTLASLEQIESQGFVASNGQNWHDHSCDQGACFL